MMNEEIKSVAVILKKNFPNKKMILLACTSEKRMQRHSCFTSEQVFPLKYLLTELVFFAMNRF